MTCSWRPRRSSPWAPPPPSFRVRHPYLLREESYPQGADPLPTAETANGLGRHTWLITTTYVPYMKSFYSSIVIYNVGICILKMSILLQYRRIFKTPLMQKLTLGGLLFGGVWALTLSVLLPLICWPVAAFWDASIDGRCLNQLASEYTSSSSIAWAVLPPGVRVIPATNTCHGSLVCYGCLEPHHRLRSLLAASSGRQEPEAPQETEGHAYGDILSGLLVRFHHLTHLDGISEAKTHEDVCEKGEC